MSDNQRTNEGHQPISLTGGGRPEQIAKGWLPDSERGGHQPVASAAEPTVGPSTPSGVSSANTPTPPPPPPDGE